MVQQKYLVTEKISFHSCYPTNWPSMENLQEVHFLKWKLMDLHIKSTLLEIYMFCSEFRDIYDEDYFIATLEGHVKVVKELPDEVMERYDYNISSIPNIRVQAWAPANYYLGEVYPVLLEKGYVGLFWNIISHCLITKEINCLETEIEAHKYFKGLLNMLFSFSIYL